MGKMTYDETGFKDTMGKLNSQFDILETSFKKLNDTITSSINVSADSGLFGEKADELLLLWKNNASTFGDFKANFDVWAETMTIVHNKNNAFTEDMLEGFKSNALNLDGVRDARAIAALQSGSAIVGYGATSVDLTYGAKVDENGRLTYENPDGSSYKYVTDTNGNLVSITLYDKNGKIVDTKNFDNVNGGVSSTYTYTNGAVQEIRYDASGNVETILEYESYDSTGIPQGEPTSITFTGGDGKRYTAKEVYGSYLVQDANGNVVTTSVDYEKIAPYVASSSNSTTLSSGDSVKIDGANYTVYGFTTTSSGEVVSMYADAEGKLFYNDDKGVLQPVMETYQTYNGYTVQNVSVPATIESVNAEHVSYYSIPNSSGYSMQQEYTSDSSLTIGDVATVSTSTAILGTVTFSNNTMNDNVVVEGKGNTPYSGINVGNSLTTTGPKLSYEDEFSNKVNGVNFVNATSMSSFQVPADLQDNQTYVVKIPQNQYVQWDSPEGGTGYEFDTTSSVYLKWNPEAGGYQIVDEYGNVTNDRVFSLDGFNNNGGANGGVWE